MQSERPSSETPEPPGGILNHSLYQKFALPHVFTPDLTLGQAFVAAMGTFTRIFLGSCLFAIWGVSSTLVWNSMANPFWRAVLTVPLVLILLGSMAGLLAGITAVGNLIVPRSK